MIRDSHGWNMSHQALVLLETKKAFNAMHYDELNGKHGPIVPDETMTQYLGEALAVWRTNRRVVDISMIRIKI